MSESATAGVVSGRRVVVAIYVGLVAFAGMMGFILGAVVEDLRSVELLGVVPIPPTPAGLAIYGAATIALLLGAFLLAIRYAASEE
ncbi:hypothetical protein [Halalkalicoccus sp. NIPERK01]|uniref:DUF7520 family protein n=1 Tax=Halalkalicoccus sp. NIPERK01 TaxID=3053469 RepID=UPI00256ED6D4|nr:hypothetical protein [Halalkalicoccus sp. NIPERK01]